ncbi:MAG: hypothetical protein DMG07_19020 [Acidobacteria bacterium]|nr:MAG: hypothetical protein DMG07_19020 [Acidobacteriota bacterium]
MAIESQEVWSLETELEHVRHLNTRVRLVAPELADSVDGLLDRIVPLAPAPGAGTRACIHGDCKPSQFLVDGSRVALVDFDRACLGDVAVDVGNFMAALRKEVVRGREYGRELASHFRSEYERCSGRSGLVDRARVFESAALVRMAVRAFKRSPKRYAHKGGDSLPVLLLREAAECLANP